MNAYDDKCATPGCERPARWIAIPEGNRLGSDASRRCAECCDVIWQSEAAELTQKRAELEFWETLYS